MPPNHAPEPPKLYRPTNHWRPDQLLDEREMTPRYPSQLPQAPFGMHPSGKDSNQLFQRFNKYRIDWYTIVAPRLARLLDCHRARLGNPISAQDFGHIRSVERMLRGIPELTHTHHHFREMALELFDLRHDYIMIAIQEGFATEALPPVDAGIMKYRIELAGLMFKECCAMERERDQHEDEAELAYLETHRRLDEMVGAEQCSALPVGADGRPPLPCGATPQRCDSESSHSETALPSAGSESRMTPDSDSGSFRSRCEAAGSETLMPPASAVGAGCHPAPEFAASDSTLPSTNPVDVNEGKPQPPAGEASGNLSGSDSFDDFKPWPKDANGNYPKIRVMLSQPRDDSRFQAELARRPSRRRAKLPEPELALA